MKGVPVVVFSANWATSGTEEGPSKASKSVPTSGGVSTWLKLVLGNLARGVAGLPTEGLLPSLESWLLFLARSSILCALFSPLCSWNFNIFFRSSSHAFSRAALSCWEKGFGGSLIGTFVAFAGGGSGDRGSSMGTGLV